MATTDEGVRYRDKITIVTGGAGCIGRACVEQFVKHGSKVVIVDIRVIKDPIEEQQDAAGAKGITKLKPGSVKKMIATTIDKFGQIDCLINNAACASIDDFALEKTTKEEFAYVLDVYVLGALIVSKYAIEHLRATKGNIINTGSMTCTNAKANALSYSVSKTGLIGLTRNIAIKEAKNGVRVNCISPAGAESVLFSSTLTTFPQEEKFKELYTKHMQSMGRPIQPEEVAKTCLYLATGATYSTGQNMYVSGGSELDYGFKHNTEWIYQSE